MAQKLSVRQVAEQYGISVRTVWRYIELDKLTAYHVGPKLVRIDADEARAQLLSKPIGDVG